ncbi:MAG TPA: DUF5132 domain-containing protein [Nitrospira sp.]|nr:DUF5132 domain-containing protein [Nitrospira sp.]
MALFDELPKGPLSTILLGIGVAMVAPTVLPSLASGLRPLAKSLVKGGVTLYDAVKEGVAEAGEQLSDLVAESRAEMAEDMRDEPRVRKAESAADRSAETAPRTRRRARA